MARKKVALAWISNDATRRATLKTRSKGLMKKVKELSILCDVRACAVVYSPHEPQPEVWPSVAEATHVLSRLRSLPESEQLKKMMNQETFLRQRVAKLHEQLRRHEREKRELESAALLRECVAGGSLSQYLRIDELAALSWLLEVKTKAVQDRIDRLRAVEAFEVAMAGEVKPTAVERAPLPLQLPAAPHLSSVIRDHKLGAYYHEAMRSWFAGRGAGGDHAAIAAGWYNYQLMAQYGRVSGMAAAGDNVLVGSFEEQNQTGWENFFPSF